MTEWMGWQFKESNLGLYECFQLGHSLLDGTLRISSLSVPLDHLSLVFACFFVLFCSAQWISFDQLIVIFRSLDKMNVYRSRIRPVARSGPIRWSGHGYVTSTLPSRGSSGSNLAGLTGWSDKGMSASHTGDKGVNPGLVTMHDALSLLPIDYNLAKSYRWVLN